MSEFETASDIRNIKTKKCSKFKMCANLNMAKVWILLAVMLSIALVSANVCTEMEKIMNCNECFRCGGYWCKDPKQKIHCFQAIEDSWCMNHKEGASTGEDLQEPGDLLEPKYSESTVFVNRNNAVRISHEGKSGLLVKSRIVNTTQNNDFYITEHTHCAKGGKCTTVIEASPKTTFCSPTGRTSESVDLKVSFEGISEEATIKYKVPCACACSDTAEKHAAMCNGRGDLSCGVCACYNGWTGANCEKPICEAKRGDMQCNNPSNNVECSGNGECGPCETCICYTDRVGSKYFDENNYCADICMTINDCDECLRDPSIGRCPQCPFPLFYRNFNETLLAQRDDQNKSVWVPCNETLPDGYHVEYVAMRDEYDTYFMIPPSKTEKAAIGGTGVNVTLPIVIAMIAAVAAVGSFVAYKFWQSRVPPVPLTDPMYTNIDAEDCTGENPLYKPPTSSFKNPTYGKW